MRLPGSLAPGGPLPVDPGPLRPWLGGTSPGSVPTATPGTGGGGTGGGGEPATPEQYAGYLVLLTAATFAAIGFFLGVKRAFTAFVLSLGAAVVLSMRWELVAATVNKLYKLVVFGLKGGPFAGDPVAAWNSVKGMAPLVPVDGSAVAFWQLTFFAAASLLGYFLAFLLLDSPGGMTNLRGVHTWLSRLFGALFGGLTGAIIALFVLPRLVPGIEINMAGVLAVLWAVVEKYGVYLFWFFVVLMILAGLLALRPKPSSRVFN